MSADYDTALDRNPKFLDAIFRRGVAYLSLGEKDKAVKDFRRELALYPAHPETQARLAHLGVRPTAK